MQDRVILSLQIYSPVSDDSKQPIESFPGRITGLADSLILFPFLNQDTALAASTIPHETLAVSPKLNVISFV